MLWSSLWMACGCRCDAWHMISSVSGMFYFDRCNQESKKKARTLHAFEDMSGASDRDFYFTPRDSSRLQQWQVMHRLLKVNQASMV